MLNQSYSAPLAAYYMSECVPSLRAEIKFTFLFSGNVSRSALELGQCEVKERGSKLQIHITHHIMCIMPAKRILIRCNTAEMSRNKTFLLANSHDCPDPSLCLHYYVFFMCSAHSRIPISSFNKCASITCWTEHSSKENWAVFYFKWNTQKICPTKKRKKLSATVTVNPSRLLLS